MRARRGGACTGAVPAGAGAGAAGTEAAGITAGAAPGMPDAATATGVGAATGTILSHRKI